MLNLRLNEKHQYFDAEGRKYVSVSYLLRKVTPEFETEKWAAIKAKKLGMTTEAVIAMWELKAEMSRERGTRIHRWIETLLKEGDDTNIPQNFANAFHDFCADNYEIVIRKQSIEQPIGSEYYLAAGTPDLVLTSPANNSVTIIDWKTNEEIGDNPFEDLKYPCQHLGNTDLQKYSLQLSFFRFFIENDTTASRKVEEMYLVHIREKEDGTYYFAKIRVPYLQREVMRILVAHVNGTLGTMPTEQAGNTLGLKGEIDTNTLNAEIDSLITAIADGNQNPVIAYVNCKKIQKALEKLQDAIKDTVVSEIQTQRYAGGAFGAKLSVASRTTYDYSHIAAWNELEVEKKVIELNIKAIESLAKSAYEKRLTEIANTQTGEAIPAAVVKKVDISPVITLS